mmetsp:Transcript_120108/g.179454  ORF Transcript_120108/g.179454 Transcript_120108/m.179454 type:complete len:231 (-) Transcript_120108:704-1396(-)
MWYEWSFNDEVRHLRCNRKKPVTILVNLPITAKVVVNDLNGDSRIRLLLAPRATAIGTIQTTILCRPRCEVNNTSSTTTTNNTSSINRSIRKRKKRKRKPPIRMETITIITSNSNSNNTDSSSSSNIIKIRSSISRNRSTNSSSSITIRIIIKIKSNTSSSNTNSSISINSSNSKNSNTNHRILLWMIARNECHRFRMGAVDPTVAELPNPNGLVATTLAAATTAFRRRH